LLPNRSKKNWRTLLPAVQQVVVVGNGRGYLCALTTGTVEAVAVQAALDAINLELPHYRRFEISQSCPMCFLRKTVCSPLMANFAANAINARLCFRNQRYVRFERRTRGGQQAARMKKFTGKTAALEWREEVIELTLDHAPAMKLAPRWSRNWRNSSGHSNHSYRRLPSAS